MADSWDNYQSIIANKEQIRENKVKIDKILDILKNQASYLIEKEIIDPKKEYKVEPEKKIEYYKKCTECGKKIKMEAEKWLDEKYKHDKKKFKEQL
jgi:hypothetical protein